MLDVSPPSLVPSTMSCCFVRLVKLRVENIHSETCVAWSCKQYAPRNFHCCLTKLHGNIIPSKVACNILPIHATKVGS
jgi:hypothetical protein